MPSEAKPLFPWCLLFVATLMVPALCGQTLYGQNVATAPEILAGTELLSMEGDLASELVAGADRFLLRKIDLANQSRAEFWKSLPTARAAYEAEIELLRAELKQRLGVRDTLASDTTPYMLTSIDRSSKVGIGKGYEVHRVQWHTFGDCYGRGLMLVPIDESGKPKKTVGQIIAIPDCEISPEQLVGLQPGVKPTSQYARLLAENGFSVVVPVLVNRGERMPKLSNREWLYRSAFELGRGMIAYEVQEIQALVRWMASRKNDAGQIGVIGWGEGGLIALYTAALDTAVEATVVSGYFQSRDNLWQEPIDRNIFGLLEHFGDAEMLPLIAPRKLIVEAAAAPEAEFAGGKGAPWQLATPKIDVVIREFKRGHELLRDSVARENMRLIESNHGAGDFASHQVLQGLVKSLGIDSALSVSENPCQIVPEYEKDLEELSRLAMQRKIVELNMHSQNLLRESHYLRQNNTVLKLDYSSMEAYEKSSSKLRDEFYEEVIGRFHDPVQPFRPRTRLFQETEKWIAYEVVLDVYPDVFAYGLLLIPKGIKAGEKRPVVVCQHGLEGRPQDTVGEKGYEAYKAFSAKLAERGFVTFAPQNLYIFKDRFRSLQRKANPIKKTLFSIITPQHQQMVDWLQTLDFVDGDRIGFYGLSYGGKTAMRVPALVPDYRLSICSADFNEWVDKNASTLNPRSYTFFGEYEIFEFDLGSTFNYAEMASLIAPRPFMVERGHNDGVADDWTVAYEYAKIRHLYAFKLKIPEQTTIEWFDGPHTINGKGTFEFLHRHLDWPITSPIEPLK